VQNFQPLSLSVFFFTLACERIFIKTHGIENRCYRTGKYTVCRLVRASFSPEILQAGAVKGLTFSEYASQAVNTNKMIKVVTIIT